MTEVRRIAIDPGFGGYKLAEATGEKVVTRIIPSVVGMGRVEDLPGVTGLGGGRRRRRPLEVVFLNGHREPVECLVGENVDLYVPPIERTDFDMLSGHWEQRALTYASLYKLFGAGEYRVRVLLALPVQAFEGQSNRAARDLGAWLEDAHEFRANGQEVRVTVEKVLPAPQPLGAFFAWGLNEKGLWGRDRQAVLHLRIAVVDIGFNTLDLISMQGGKPVQRFTRGRQLGMSRPAALLMNEIQRRYGRALSLHEADALLRAHLEKKPVQTVAAGEQIDVKALARGVFDQWGGEVVAYLGAIWGADPGFAATLVTGGGAPAVAKALRVKWQNVEVLPDPVTANARGLALYALRDAIWK